jgi:hypothetical protein
MGTGSLEYAQLWSKRFQALRSIQQAHATYPEVRSRTFPNGEWIFLVSANSHRNPWGGTVVTKDSHGQVHTFFGHVCGHADTGMETKSLADVYRRFSGSYGSTPEEWIHTQAERQRNPRD